MATWCTEVFFGGSRGGGKSDGLLGDFLQDVARYQSAWRGVIFRRTYPELQELQRRARELFPQTGATCTDDRDWKWPDGATLAMRYIENVKDASRYQGHQYTWIGWDEITQYPSDEAYCALFACLRSSQDVPTKRIRASGNPGGAGHGWVKWRFVDHGPLGYEPRIDPATKHRIMYIPSRVWDNKILLKNDPSYVDRLRGVGSEALVKAWLDGDWNIVTGAYFTEFGEQLIIDPFTIPKHWTKFMSMDWGRAKPFSIGWYAVCDGDMGGRVPAPYPVNSLIKYREWYGKKTPNVGIGLDADVVAQRAKSMELPDENITYRVADPSIFKSESGPPISETMRNFGLTFMPADNSRIPGANQLHQRFRGIDNRPMMYFFKTNYDTIRTFPMLQHDSKKPEDVDTEGEDHAYDETRYAAMSRPFTSPIVYHEDVKDIRKISLNKLYELDRRHRRRDY